MTNETPSTSTTEQKPHQFGARLQSAREAMGIDRKDAAAQLHLQEKVIIMIESGLFDSNLPLTFIRGYIRNYSKLLEIPDQEVKDALNLIKPRPDQIEAETVISPALRSSSTSIDPVTYTNIFMQIFTSLIVITLIGLVAIWWHSHKAMDNRITSVSDPVSQPISINQQPEDQPAPINPDMIATAVDAGLTAAMSPNVIETRSPEKIETASVEAAEPTPVNLSPAADAPHITPSKPDTQAVKRQAAPPQQNKLAHYFYRVVDQQVAQQIIYGDDYLRSLLNFILFLIILNLSLRNYHPPFSYLRMDSGRTIHRSRFGRSRNRLRGMEPNRFKLIKPLAFITVFAIVSLIGYFSWHHRTSPTPVISAKPATQATTTTIAANNHPEDNLQLDADLESLAPSSHLDVKILNAFRINAMQAMINQLNDYIARASAVQFALTDPSTDLGQFTYKKKYRHRHRQVVQQYNQNADPYNDNETTSTY